MIMLYNTVQKNLVLYGIACYAIAVVRHNIVHQVHDCIGQDGIM